MAGSPLPPAMGPMRRARRGRHPRGIRAAAYRRARARLATQMPRAASPRAAEAAKDTTRPPTPRERAVPSPSKAAIETVAIMPASSGSSPSRWSRATLSAAIRQRSKLPTSRIPGLPGERRPRPVRAGCRGAGSYAADRWRRRCDSVQSVRRPSPHSVASIVFLFSGLIRDSLSRRWLARSCETCCEVGFHFWAARAT